MKVLFTPLLITSVILGAVDSGPASPKLSRRAQAVAASLILPGAGQMFLGAKVRGEAQIWIDGALWLVWAGFRWQSGLREQDARLIAYAHAGASKEITDRRFFRILEEYDNSDEFNEDVRREARRLFPDDPDAQWHYFETHAYLGDSAWDWDSDSFRVKVYWPLRRAARNAALGAGFVAGALVLNRLISVIDCAFILPEPKLSSRLELVPRAEAAGVEVRYRF